MKTLLLAGLALVTMSPTVTASSIEAGDRVRVIDRTGRIGLVGTVTSIGSWRLSLYVDDLKSTRELYFQSVDRLEKSNGRNRHFGAGILVGAAVGLVAGVVWTLSEPISHSEDGTLTDVFFPEGPGLAAVALATVVGAMFGGTIGFFVTTERWENVPIDQLGVAPSPRHLQVRIQIGFRSRGDK